MQTNTHIQNVPTFWIRPVLFSSEISPESICAASGASRGSDSGADTVKGLRGETDFVEKFLLAHPISSTISSPVI